MSNSSNNSSSKKSEAMNRFKQECANEVGVNLKSGYNGDLTSMFKANARPENV